MVKHLYEFIGRCKTEKSIDYDSIFWLMRPVREYLPSCSSKLLTGFPGFFGGTVIWLRVGLTGYIRLAPKASWQPPRIKLTLAIRFWVSAKHHHLPFTIWSFGLFRFLGMEILLFLLLTSVQNQYVWMYCNMYISSAHSGFGIIYDE